MLNKKNLNNDEDVIKSSNNLIWISAFNHNGVATKKEEMENQKITQTITNLFNGTDERNWTKVKTTLAENVLLDFSSLSGKPASVITSKQIIDNWAAFLPGFDKTHHQISDLQIQQNDKTATVHYNGKADHFIGKEVWSVEGTYDDEVINTNNSWIITKHKFNLIKQSGNLDLPAKAANVLSHKIHQ